jgi:hypothetical protein
MAEDNPTCCGCKAAPSGARKDMPCAKSSCHPSLSLSLRVSDCDSLSLYACQSFCGPAARPKDLEQVPAGVTAGQQ